MGVLLSLVARPAGGVAATHSDRPLQRLDSPTRRGACRSERGRFQPWSRVPPSTRPRISRDDLSPAACVRGACCGFGPASSSSCCAPPVTPPTLHETYVSHN